MPSGPDRLLGRPVYTLNTVLVPFRGFSAFRQKLLKEIYPEGEVNAS